MDTPQASDWVGAAEAVSKLHPTLSTYAAQMRICERAEAGMIRSRASQYHQGDQVFKNHDIPKRFWWAKGHEALEQDWAVGDFSTWIDRRIELRAFGVTFARSDIESLVPPRTIKHTELNHLTQDDRDILEKLFALVPSAALSYQQAILDLGDDSRVSFRGPALELREALREILDHLAPDGDVMASPSYINEDGRSVPTMKQKVRFIMRGRGNGAVIEAPERTVTAFEEALANLTRAVYNLSSRATHVAGERQTVVQLRRYIVTILHDILRR